uniref:Histidine--tRNA ligase, chloroplastic n=1 Tax=Ophidocladus simpliciusculus TaxID=1261574 RepID=A0A1Z1MJ36_9FLOR|nr:Histidine-tRNA ligase [Ophidocladus simpliciusculus]ARW66087.1 Histidine-tRNA ligase [Ophidocladus simpliciusculus]
MQPLRGTKDILPYEIKLWQQIYNVANEILTANNYYEIRTPILENTELFNKGIGNFTDIVNKEMYSFNDQGERNITLRPEGTASIARAFISNKLYLKQKINRLWYLGPMFRYERPQRGRQRQFHQLGIECIGSSLPIADVEVIRLAIKTLDALGFKEYILEINSIGNMAERDIYKNDLIKYLKLYQNDLDRDSQKKLLTNPLRILDSKNLNTQTILQQAPKLKNYLNEKSLDHFKYVCNSLKYLNIAYKINDYLVRGLDYYNCTAFEIKMKKLSNQNTICGGGRYDTLIEQLGGPYTPSVGWAIGIERLITIKNKNFHLNKPQNIIYIAHQEILDKYKIWDILDILENYEIKFELDLSNNNLYKQIKRANQMKAKICLILGEEEIKLKYITIKWLETGTQQKIHLSKFYNYLKYIKQQLET